MSTERLQLPAEWGSWQAVADHARARAEALQLDADAQARLVVCLDELFTNALKHGKAAERGGQVAVAVDGQPDRQVTLVWEDDGPPFDPLAWLAANPPGPPGQAPGIEGGFGLGLIAGWAQEIAYDRDEGWNRLRVVLPG
jgi:anti-sigma regulatory factor (Ser/Thr protein kinase)